MRKLKPGHNHKDCRSMAIIHPSLPRESKSTFSRRQLPFVLKRERDEGKKPEYLNPKNIIIPNGGWQRKDSQDV